MYSIQKRPYGYFVLIEGRFDEAEASRLRDEVQTVLAGNSEKFSTIVDIRKLVPPHAVCLDLLREAIDFAFKAGMERVAAIYNSPVIRDMLRQVAFASGRNPVGRYIDASKVDDPDRAALEYVNHGIEPPSTMTQKIRVMTE